MRWAMRIWWISSAPSAKRAQRACVQHVRQRRVGRVAERAVDLDRAVDDPPQAVGDEVLGHRHHGRELHPLLESGRRRAAPSACTGTARPPSRRSATGCPASRRGASRGCTARASGPPSCRARSRPDRSSACSARAVPGRAGTDRAGDPDRARRACWRAGTRRSSIRISQWLCPPDIVWTSRTMFQPSDGRSTMKHELRRLRDLRILLGAGDEQRELGAASAGDEPLVAVDHPLVAVAVGQGLDQRRVGAGDLRLGHREARPGRALAQRAEVLLLLLVGRPVQQRVLVALVGRLGVEHERADRRPWRPPPTRPPSPSGRAPSRPTPSACAAATAPTPRAPPCGA